MTIQEQFAKTLILETTLEKVKICLEGVVKRGTGKKLHSANFDIAGKTGTTQNQSDGWFMGMVPNLVTGVWVGAEDRAAHFKGIDYGQGASMALPIWGLYMKACYADETLNISTSDFEKPTKLSINVECIAEDEGDLKDHSDTDDEVDFDF